MTAPAPGGLDPDGLRARAVALGALRRWFDAHGYLEVPTPVIVPSPALESTLYGVTAGGGWLRTSPEMALKRVVASGLPRVVEIGPCFRAEERGPWHGREFLMCEWYRAGATIDDLMDEVAALVTAVADALGVPAPTWQRATVRALVARHAGVDLATATPAEIHPAEPHDADQAFFRRWLEDVEPRLRGGWFVTAWPASQAALAQVRAADGHPVALRFEAYLDGIELANAFGEVTEAATIRARATESAVARAARGEPPHPVDEPFVAAVDRLPPCAGIALGVERLVAVLLGARGLARFRADHPDDPFTPR